MFPQKKSFAASTYLDASRELLRYLCFKWFFLENKILSY